MGEQINYSISEALENEMSQRKLRYISKKYFDYLLKIKINKKITAELFTTMVRYNTLYMISKAGSGHIGGSFSSIDIVSWLYLNILEKKDKYFSSKGHDAPGLYSIQLALGIINFEKIHSLRRLNGLPGHPDIKTPGSVTNTGSLGMGISKAKGFIFANGYLHKDSSRIFVLLGDGELQEGQIWESLISASRLNNNSLYIIVDHNKIQSDTYVSNVSDLGRIEEKFTSFGCETYRIDGHDFDKIDSILNKKSKDGRPIVLIADTIKGKGVSFMEHTSMKVSQDYYEYHSGAPNFENYERARIELESKINRIIKDNNLAYIEFTEIETENIKIEKNTERLIEHYKKSLIELASNDDKIIALDADLILDTGLIEFKNRFPDRFIECGIAEQDMVSQAGTLSLSGLLPIVHSFACFLTSRASEQIYNNCTQENKVIYVGSLAGLLPAGPGHSHQALRDVTAMSAMPNLTIIEPSTPDQVFDAIKWAIKVNNFSTYLRLTSIPVKYEFDYKSSNQFKEGIGNVIFESDKVESTIIVSNPVLLNQIVIALNKLSDKSKFQIIIMPWLNKIDKNWFKSKLLNKNKNVIVFENHYNSYGYGDFILSSLTKFGLLSNSKSFVFGIDKLPLSGRNEEVLKEFSLDYESIYKILEDINEK
jgi:transketolase